MALGITIGGQVLPLIGLDGQPAASVLDWHDTKLEFRAGSGFNKRRHDDIDLCVWHWTGGENEPDVMFKTLQARELGIEFAISRQGVVWQFCDPLVVDTADASRFNSRSVGVEIVGYGVPGRLRLGKPPKLGRDREQYVAEIHGRIHTIGHMYPRQMAAAYQLADALGRGLHVRPLVWPRTTFLPGTRFNGHLGHFQISAQKLDPGPRFLTDLAAYFARTATPEENV